MNKYKQHIIKIHGHEPTSLDDFGQCILNILQHNSNNRVLGFSFDVQFGDCSNTHHAPVGKPLNWRRRDSLPTSYPGYHGRMWLRLFDRKSGEFFSDFFRGTMTYPGSGGAGSYNGPWHYLNETFYSVKKNKKVPEWFIEPNIGSLDYKFFIEDWPLLEKWTEHTKTLNLLKNKSNRIRHNFLYEDQETVELDKKFIEYANNLGK